MKLLLFYNASKCFERVTIDNINNRCRSIGSKITVYVNIAFDSGDEVS